MNKVRRIDFVLYEDDDEMLVFRFRPRQSNCHSFNDTPPVTWDDVYKVYYSYAIFRRYKDGSGHTILFSCSCDECSIIDEVAARCVYLAEGKQTVDVIHPRTDETRTIKLLNNQMIPMGMGVSWEIKKICHKYEFDLFDCGGVGFRFCIGKEMMKRFGEYLNECCEYMLAHGDPI